MTDQVVTAAATPATPTGTPAAAATAAESTAITQAAVSAPGATEAAASTDNQGTVSPADSQTSQQEGEKPAARAPEAYTEFASGSETPLLPEQQAFYTKAAKEMDLTQEQAQALVKLGQERTQQEAQRLNEASAKWLAELPSDKELGGEKLQENLGIAKKAIDTFGTPALKQLLETTKLGNNPEVIRAFYRAGLKISPDNRFVSGAQGDKPAAASVADRLFTNSKTA